MDAFSESKLRAELDALTWTHYVPHIDDLASIGNAIGSAVAIAVQRTYSDLIADYDPVALAIFDIQSDACMWD